MKKIILICLAVFLFSPFVFAENSQINTYQKLKNITRHDPPAGSNLTIGFLDDEIRFLILVQNKNASVQTFILEDILPQYLIYQGQSAFWYKVGSGAGWQKISDENDFPFKNYTVTLDPEAGYYFKFSTRIAANVPPNNLTLANFVKIYDAQKNLIEQTVTKVLAPNLKTSALQTKDLSQQQIEYVNQRVQEEENFIENKFLELQQRGFVAVNSGQDMLPQKEKVAGNQNFWPQIRVYFIFLVSVGLVLAVAYRVKLCNTLSFRPKSFKR